ncbi:MAG: hypothetical protein JRF65_01535 [Deltaproteobacteria bacterium]|nr:hypothetical protein [Deltaproteobacteria bacterium]
MTELKIGDLLLNLALLFVLTYLLAALLERRRIPGILAALFVTMAVRYTPLGMHLLSPEFHMPLSFLADLGVLFLLFFIGSSDRSKGDAGSERRHHLAHRVEHHRAVPDGRGVMPALGYGWLPAFVIGLTRMPTAEAVIVPILNVGYARFASETSQMQENTFQTEAHRYMIWTLVLITI